MSSEDLLSGRNTVVRAIELPVRARFESRFELVALTKMLVATGVRPVIDRTLALADAAEGFAAMIDGEVFGKVVFTP